MKDCAPEGFKYPSTRYSGSKRRLLDWIWEHVKDLKFNTVLDLFGGTGSVSLMFKRYGKRVFYNDILKFNQLIGIAIIENKNTFVSDSDIDKILTFDNKRDYPDFIQKNFKDIFFLNHENEWLDKVTTNILNLKNRYKKAILFASLFQSCLAKRPFNLFHRANLYIRTTNVPRSFGNKTTWETPFEQLLRRFVKEYNRAVFDNGKKNSVIGGYDATSAPNGVDLVYIDPPYFSQKSGGTNYMVFYHFLEGLADYKNWGNRIKDSNTKIKKINDTPEIKAWTHKELLRESFKKVIERFQDTIIVLSYQEGGIPSKEEIVEILNAYKKFVKVYSISHRYVLSPEAKNELLFIAK